MKFFNKLTVIIVFFTITLQVNAQKDSKIPKYRIENKFTGKVINAFDSVFTATLILQVEDFENYNIYFKKKDSQDKLVNSNDTSKIKKVDKEVFISLEDYNSESILEEIFLVEKKKDNLNKEERDKNKKSLYKMK